MMTQNNLSDQVEERFRKRASERERVQAMIKDNEHNPFTIDSPVRAFERAKFLGVELTKDTRQPIMDSIRNDPVKRLAVERILGTNNLLPANFLPRGNSCRKSIGRICIRQGNRLVGYGTGFLVSPNLLLTNNHVLDSPNFAVDSILQMNYEEEGDTHAITPADFFLDPESIFISDNYLDYTLVAVNPRNEFGNETSQFGHIQPYRDTGKVLLGEHVNIIQHPGGEPKQIAIRENHIVDLLTDFIHYETDTGVGSSGSAVFSDQWLLVALHHASVPRRTNEGKVLRKDGKLWTEADGDDSIDWIANEGVRISSIMKHIESHYLDQKGKQLVDDLLKDSVLRSVFVSTMENDRMSKTQHPNDRSTSQPVRDTARDDRQGYEPRVDSQGTQIHHGSSSQEMVIEQSFVIPVRISVSIGEISSSNQSFSRGSSLSGSSITPVSREAEKAMLQFLEARDRPYYAEDEDARDRDSYYSEIDFQAGSDKLAKSLSKLLSQTHKSRRYSPGKNLYPWVDLYPDYTLRSIYTMDKFNALELINESIRMEENFLKSMERAESQLEGQMRDLEMAHLEASLAYNCEHSVPQSWFNKREPMKGDLHHLFTCEARANGFRGNAKFTDFEDYDNPDQDREVVKEGWGKLERNEFEPYLGKGQVARGTLYFLLRYPGEISKSNYDLDVLLDWHESYPPSLYEKHRNAAIFEMQGNRNPLIDFPEEAASIGFSTTAKTRTRE
ncbi:MAG: endonuclease [Candidatus Obscuribacterales bacterium]